MPNSDTGFPDNCTMHTPAATLAALVIAVGLTGCTVLGNDDPPKVYEPGSSVTKDPPGPRQHDPLCRVQNMCPR